jgi:hypothetical protein
LARDKRGKKIERPCGNVASGSTRPRAPQTRDTLAAAAGVSPRTAQAALTLQKTTQHRRRRGAIRAYLQRAGASFELQNDAAELKLHAERKAGGLLAGMEKHAGAATRSHDTMALSPRLADLVASVRSPGRVFSPWGDPPGLYRRQDNPSRLRGRRYGRPRVTPALPADPTRLAPRLVTT